jgi:hypothetical protein
LCIGDGSGTGWMDACGWAGVLIDNSTRGRLLVKGAMDPASVNMAELMPYYQAFSRFHEEFGHKRLKRTGTLNCHVVTDSQTIAKWGAQTSDLSQPLPRPGFVYHAGLRELVRMGYQLTYHWAPRSTSLLNWAADLISALCRKEILKLANPTVDAGVISWRAMEAIRQVVFCNPATGEPINLYDLNPIEETNACVPANQPAPAGQPGPGDRGP